MAILLHDVTYPWGVLMAVRQTKTICFGKRVLSVPFNIVWIDILDYCLC